MWCHATLRSLNRLSLERANDHKYLINRLSWSQVCDLNGHCWAFSDLSLVKSSSWQSHSVPWCAALRKQPSRCKTQAIFGTHWFTFVTHLSCGHNDFQHCRKTRDAKHPLLSEAKTQLCLLYLLVRVSEWTALLHDQPETLVRACLKRLTSWHCSLLALTMNFEGVNFFAPAGATLNSHSSVGQYSIVSAFRLRPKCSMN